MTREEFNQLHPVDRMFVMYWLILAIKKHEKL